MSALYVYVYSRLSFVHISLIVTLTLSLTLSLGVVVLASISDAHGSMQLYVPTAARAGAPKEQCHSFILRVSQKVNAMRPHNLLHLLHQGGGWVTVW